ncbi:hypothetical protein ACFLU6_08170 [Acidobacteriota bacterium]
MPRILACYLLLTVITNGSCLYANSDDRAASNVITGLCTNGDILYLAIPHKGIFLYRMSDEENGLSLALFKQYPCSSSLDSPSHIQKYEEGAIFSDFLLDTIGRVNEKEIRILADKHGGVVSPFNVGISAEYIYIANEGGSVVRRLSIKEKYKMDGTFKAKRHITHRLASYMNGFVSNSATNIYIYSEEENEMIKLNKILFGEEEEIIRSVFVENEIILVYLEDCILEVNVKNSEKKRYYCETLSKGVINLGYLTTYKNYILASDGEKARIFIINKNGRECQSLELVLK